MTPSPRSRDLNRLGVSTLTAVAGAISLTAVGWFAGAAARQHQSQQAHDDVARAATEAKAARLKAQYDAAMAKRKSAMYPQHVVLRTRPARTVVHTRYVRGATAPVVVGGGTFSAPPPPVSNPGPVAHPAPPPPPPPPPPAPSSGSHHG